MAIFLNLKYSYHFNASFSLFLLSMKTKKAFILLNGSEPATFPDLSKYEIVCAIDGAYNYFEANNIIPDLVTGDFDSINTIPTSVEVIKTPDQEFTDFEKALQILKQRGFSEIDVYGGSGKEHDHFLGNISTALQWKLGLSIFFFDDYGKYFFIEESILLTNVKGRNISLIPFPNAFGIVTKGLLYPLKDETLTFGERIGTRNKATDENVLISYEKGNLLVYLSNF
ncbi:thiamine diphosphokinase [Lutibacter flavus]|uniref:Thiamine diphosphokinase n=1 Tax=Lutibacter flavus TaxID=691689 RepID=A0A238Z151_9FLAO|nr:thiamine diphosphokinase [Lutibacter flavus]SNR76589.1 thiamine pyrophosphokinase [Lutibacter flavus]